MENMSDYIEKIKEKDISKFRHKDVLGTEEEPVVVIIRYSPSSANYSFCELSDYHNITANAGYKIDNHPKVKSQNKWLLTQEFGYHWGRIADERGNNN